MAKLPTQKRILREDIKEAPSWIEKLLYPINSFMELVYSALNKNITFEDNISSSQKTLTFLTLSTYSSATPKVEGFDPLTFNHNLKYKPSTVILQQIVVSEDLYEVITDPVTIQWQEINGVIYITYITGLKDFKSYTVRFLVF